MKNISTVIIALLMCLFLLKACKSGDKQNKKKTGSESNTSSLQSSYEGTKSESTDSKSENITSSASSIKKENEKSLSGSVGSETEKKDTGSTENVIKDGKVDENGVIFLPEVP